MSYLINVKHSDWQLRLAYDWSSLIYEPDLDTWQSLLSQRKRRESKPTSWTFLGLATPPFSDSQSNLNFHLQRCTKKHKVSLLSPYLQKHTQHTHSYTHLRAEKRLILSDANVCIANVNFESIIPPRLFWTGWRWRHLKTLVCQCV